MSDVAAEYALAWNTVQRVLVAAAAELTVQSTAVIGIDETRARSVRWLLAEAGWRRSDPWTTSIVDLAANSRQGILGLALGRSGACVECWLSLQSSAFRQAVQGWR